MKHVFCVRDRVAQVFQPPFYEIHKTQAMRSFEAACRDKNEGNQFALYPDDFELMYLGTFDELTGQFALVERYEVLATPRDFVRGESVSAVPGVRHQAPTVGNMELKPAKVLN